jgi:hypothetical protein
VEHGDKVSGSVDEVSRSRHLDDQVSTIGDKVCALIATSCRASATRSYGPVTNVRAAGDNVSQLCKQGCATVTKVSITSVTNVSGPNLTPDANRTPVTIASVAHLHDAERALLLDASELDEVLPWGRSPPGSQCLRGLVGSMRSQELARTLGRLRPRWFVMRMCILSHSAVLLQPPCSTSVIRGPKTGRELRIARVVGCCGAVSLHGGRVAMVARW